MTAGADGARLSGHSFNGRYEALKGEVDAYLSGNLPSFEAEGHKLLGEAMRYSALAGGKRIRGVLALAVRDLLTEDCLAARGAIIHIAGAIEYIHAYSLIHDDMPCMDDDDFRRGKHSCHKVYGEGMAMLAGDALLNLAFEILLDKACELAPQALSARFVSASALIARAAGACGMAGGQAIDLGATFTDEARLDHMHRLKTGRLFGAAVLAPAVCMGAGEDEYSALRSYSEAIGQAFQVRDDLSDAEGEEGTDDRLNYAAMFGADRAREKLAAACDEAVGSLGRFSGRADFLRQIAHFIAEGP